MMIYHDNLQNGGLMMIYYGRNRKQITKRPSSIYIPYPKSPGRPLPNFAQKVEDPRSYADTRASL